MREITVIGGGPAGIAAAAAALRGGAAVTLVDDAEQLGGQFFRHPPEEFGAARPDLLHHGWDRFRRSERALLDHPRCEVMTGASVWAIEPGEQAPLVHLLCGPADGDARDTRTLRPDALILATGSHDRTLPFPGWDLPGVCTAGAAQALAKGERVAAGQRVLVAGSGPFLLPVAQSLTQVGAQVVGVLEANSARRVLSGWLPSPGGLSATAAKTGELAGYAANHVRHRIPYRLGSAVVAAHGKERLTEVTVADLAADWSPIAGTERRLSVDAVCVSHGFSPRLELAAAAGCRIGAARTVAVDGSQRTTAPSVFAAGEITGIGGADLARAEGTVAGWAAAGRAITEPVLRPVLRRRRRFRDFARRMHRAHPIGGGWPGWLTPETIVCRCEEVSAGALRRACESTDAGSLRSLRLSSRAGLGICQARICGATVSELAAGYAPSGVSAAEATTDRRPIAVPIRLGELAES